MLTLPKVAYFDDDVANLSFYKQILGDEFSIQTFQNSLKFAEVIDSSFSAILIDVMMPGMDGFELYQEIRKHPKYNGCPILFITADNSDEIRYKSIEIGGHDYLNRMMKRDELILRIQNRINFFHENRRLYHLGKVKIDTASLKVFFEEVLIDLTMIELKVLKTLVTKYPDIISRESLCQEVWPDQQVQSTTLNTHLYNLRVKFADWDYDIQSVKSRGIQLALKE